MKHKNDHILGYFKSNAYPSETIDGIEHFFADLGLPLPQHGEFRKTEDVGALVLLTPIACTLRLTQPHHTECEHPRILKPLFRRSVGNFLDGTINPGVLTPFQTNDYSEWYGIYEKMEAELAKAGIEVKDINANNGGVLPAPHQDYHLFIDPGALAQLRQATQSTEELLNPQDKIFGPARHLFETAWPQNSAVPEQEKLSAAWAKCLEMKDAGIFVPNWEHVDYEGTTETAKKYGARLTHLIPKTFAA